jgi:hypothetical protein
MVMSAMAELSSLVGGSPWCISASTSEIVELDSTEASYTPNTNNLVFIMENEINYIFIVIEMNAKYMLNALNIFHKPVAIFVKHKIIGKQLLFHYQVNLLECRRSYVLNSTLSTVFMSFTVRIISAALCCIYFVNFTGY